MSQNVITIRTLVIEKDEGWIAQCLDYDIVAQARTFPKLRAELERLLVSHVLASVASGREPFAGFTPAPQRYWDLYERTNARIELDDDEFESTSIPSILPKLKITHSSLLECV